MLTGGFGTTDTGLIRRVQHKCIIKAFHLIFDLSKLQHTLLSSCIVYDVYYRSFRWSLGETLAGSALFALLLIIAHFIHLYTSLYLRRSPREPCTPSSRSNSFSVVGSTTATMLRSMMCKDVGNILIYRTAASPHLRYARV